MRLSGDGVTYMPNGQCPVWRREAYSSETAVRVRAGTGSSAFVTLAVRVFCRLPFVGEERSIVGGCTRLDSMMVRGERQSSKCSSRNLSRLASAVLVTVPEIPGATHPACQRLPLQSTTTQIIRGFSSSHILFRHLITPAVCIPFKDKLFPFSSSSLQTLACAVLKYGE